MNSRVLRAVLTAGLSMLLLGPAFGLAPVAFAQSGSGASSALDASWPRDISWPQCGGTYPARPAYGIVGVNAGIVFSPNPCLASELLWAGGAGAGLYANTGNPGPGLSSHWPEGQTTPMACDANDPDTAACAYDYGYNAAADSYATAAAAFRSLGLSASPASSAWWLDVETENSWRSDPARNVANLQGAVDFLESVAKVASVGFYSTQYQWDLITGGTNAFVGYRSWVAGAGGALEASANCGGPGFTGGGVELTQYQSGGYDVDLRCSSVTQVPTGIDVTPGAPAVQAGDVQRFNATVLDQFGQPLFPQPAVTWSVSGGGTISSAGVFTAGAAPGGPYTVTASSGGVSGTASVTVTAPPRLAAITISPGAPTVQTGGTQLFSATALDQYGRPLAAQPEVTWSVSGGGTISSAGVFTAGATPGGPYTVTAASGGVSGTANVTVVAVGPVATATGGNNDYSIAAGLTVQPEGEAYALDGANDAISVAVRDASGTSIGSNVDFTYMYAPAGVFTLAPDGYDALDDVWNFNATCQAPGTASVTLTAHGGSSGASASTDALQLTCAKQVTLSTPGTFSATPLTATVAPGGVATVKVRVRDAGGLPAPDGTPVVAVSDGVGNVVGFGGIVGGGTTVDGTATLTYLAPTNTGSGTVTVSVPNATPAALALTFTIAAPPAPAVHATAASALGVTRSGPFTAATKVAAPGAYITVRLSFGAAAAGKDVTIEMATKTGGTWSAFGARTSRTADSRGNVYLFWRSATPAWLSIRGELDGVRSNAVQARWA